VGAALLARHAATGRETDRLEAPTTGRSCCTPCALGDVPQRPLPHLVRTGAVAAGDNSNFTAALNSGQETFRHLVHERLLAHESVRSAEPRRRRDQLATRRRWSDRQHRDPGHLPAQHRRPSRLLRPVAYALVTDALTHPGRPTRPRIDRSVCSRLTMPFVNLADVPTYTVHLYNILFLDRFVHEPHTSREPPLKCYVTPAAQRLPPRPRGGGRAHTESRRGSSSSTGANIRSRRCP